MDEEQLSERFRTFSETEVRHSSSLYEQLALGIAEDAELLELAAPYGAGQPPPNLLFAAVQYLLLKSPGTEPLRQCYFSLTDTPRIEDLLPLFRLGIDRNPLDVTDPYTVLWIIGIGRQEARRSRDPLTIRRTRVFIKSRSL